MFYIACTIEWRGSTPWIIKMFQTDCKWDISHKKNKIWKLCCVYFNCVSGTIKYTFPGIRSTCLVLIGQIPSLPFLPKKNSLPQSGIIYTSIFIVLFINHLTYDCNYLNNICSLSLFDSRLRTEDRICWHETKVCALDSQFKKSLRYRNYACMLI